MLKNPFRKHYNTLTSELKPLLETPIDAIDHNMLSLVQLQVSLSGQGLVREKQCYASGWWMVANGHRIGRRRCIEPRCIIVSQYPNSWA